MTIPGFNAEASLGKMKNSYALTLGRKRSVPDSLTTHRSTRPRVFIE
jgi:hypothetical protein